MSVLDRLIEDLPNATQEDLQTLNDRILDKRTELSKLESVRDMLRKYVKTPPKKSAPASSFDDDEEEDNDC